MSLSLWIHPANVADCLRGAGIRVRRAGLGHANRGSDADAIISSGIAATWNGRSYTASPGHFHTFWVRDLCFSAVALARLGDAERARLRASLTWALEGWRKHRSHITTTFHIGGYPADVYSYGVDSLPLFLAGVRAAGGDDLIEKYRGWFETEIAHFVERVVDPATGLVRDDRKYSAHRDTVTNRSNAYGNSMVALLAKTIAEKSEWGLSNPLERYFPAGDYAALLREHFWMGDRFRDAIGSDETSGEANIWPFWTGVIEDDAMLATALGTLEDEGYADPYPLRYTTHPTPSREVWLVRHLLPDYQGSSIWTSLGAMYLSLLRTVDAAKAEAGTKRYVEWIERDGTYWEVLNNLGRCWVGRARLMLGEESMLWGAIFLDLLRNPLVAPATLSWAPVPVAVPSPHRGSARLSA